VRSIAGLLLFLSFNANAQFVPSGLSQTQQMDMLMRQQYTNYLTPQQQVQLAQMPPAQRLQVLQSINLGNNRYAMQFVPQTGTNMGQTMWAMQTQQNPLFNFFTALGAATKNPAEASYMEARREFTGYTSPDPSERRDPSEAAIDTMARATTKVSEMKDPVKPAVICNDCLTDPQPKLTAPAISGKGTIKTSGNGQISEDLNADVKCSYGGDVIDGIRLTFRTDLELKVEHNQVKHLKYTMYDGSKTCVADLTKFTQKKVGNTTNVVLRHPNNETFVVVGADNKTDRKNPTVNVSVNQFAKFCPQMNPKMFMQIAADPKTGTCR
jgi:hypothetical protein